MVHIYGIKNCSTVKKALDWLKLNNVDYIFHDFKKEGLSIEKAEEWQQVFGWEPLINKKGTTWRKLPQSRQDEITEAESARKLMQEQTSLIKRPILEKNGSYLLGFDINEYSNQLL